MITWEKKSGLEIVTNSLPATVKYGKKVGWKIISTTKGDPVDEVAEAVPSEDLAALRSQVADLSGRLEALENYTIAGFKVVDPGTMGEAIAAVDASGSSDTPAEPDLKTQAEAMEKELAQEDSELDAELKS